MSPSGVTLWHFLHLYLHAVPVTFRKQTLGCRMGGATKFYEPTGLGGRGDRSFVAAGGLDATLERVSVHFIPLLGALLLCQYHTFRLVLLYCSVCVRAPARVRAWALRLACRVLCLL